MSKTLCATTDFLDNVIWAERHFTKQDLDGMMAYCASLGAARHEWVMDTVWTLYDEDSPVGFDLLQAACDAAHRYGMRFDVVFKPFEGALVNQKALLPHTFPKPEGVRLLEEPFGRAHVVRPFLADNPHMRMARRPSDTDPGGRISAIRLIKRNDEPTRVGCDDLSLWTSSTNGGFAKYDGPIEFREHAEWRRGFPYKDTASRILTLHGLDLPDETRCLVVTCAKQDQHGDFTNAIERIVELVNERGQVIPSTPGDRRIDGERLYERSTLLARLELTPYARHSEVRALFEDRERFLEHCRDRYMLGDGFHDVTLDRAGEIAIMRGKTPHVTAALNPAYPEVRQHWLDAIRFCINRGVDGVNIRPTTHNQPYEPWAFGFNGPVLERMQQKDSVAEVRRIVGDAYTRFLSEARDLLHASNRELGVHVHGLMMRHDDRNAYNTALLRNIDYQWEHWVRELADFVEFRDANRLRPENLAEVVDRIGLVAREAGIPLIYQSSRGPSVVHFDGPHPTLAQEMQYAHQHPDVTEYNLYETANYSQIDADDRFVGSPDMAALVKQHWPTQG